MSKIEFSGGSRDLPVPNDCTSENSPSSSIDDMPPDLQEMTLGIPQLDNSLPEVIFTGEDGMLPDDNPPELPQAPLSDELYLTPIYVEEVRESSVLVAGVGDLQSPDMLALEDKEDRGDLPDNDDKGDKTSGQPEQDKPQEGKPENPETPLGIHGINRGNGAKLAAIGERLKEAEERQVQALAKINDALDDMTSEQVDEMFDRAFSELPDNTPPSRETTEKVALSLVNELGAERFASIEVLFREFLVHDEQGTMLEGWQKMLALEECNRLGREMVEAVDWDKLMRDVSGLTENAPPENPKGFFMMLREDNTELESAVGGLSVLQEWAGYCIEHDLIADKSAPAPDDTVLERQRHWLAEGSLEEAIHTWRDATGRTLTYLSDERQFEAKKKMLATGKQLKNIRLALHALGSDQDTTAIPEQIRGAAERCAAEAFDTFDSADRAFLERDIQQGPFHIENAELFQRSTGIADPYAWVQEKLYNFPQGFPSELWRGLLGVRFTDENKEYQNEVSNGGVKSIAISKDAGYYNRNERRIIIDVNPLFDEERKDYHDAYKNPEDAEAAIKNEVARILSYTWDHEAAHYFHNHTMPISWLRKYHKITKQEDVKVTDYVARKHDTQAGPWEDLAETVMLYKQSPGELLEQGAYERFYKINELLQLHDPDVVKGIIQSIERGKQDDDPLWSGNSVSHMANKILFARADL